MIHICSDWYKAGSHAVVAPILQDIEGPTQSSLVAHRHPTSLYSFLPIPICFPTKIQMRLCFGVNSAIYKTPKHPLISTLISCFRYYIHARAGPLYVLIKLFVFKEE
jgi:hypothetical protein